MDARSAKDRLTLYSSMMTVTLLINPRSSKADASESFLS